MPDVRVQGLGTYLPGDGVTNAEVSDRYGGFIAALSEELGVATRHWAADPETGMSTEDNASLATRAAERALDDAGVEANEIDLIILATVTPDHMFPGPAAFVQERLGARRAAVLDLRIGCFGLAQGVSIASQFLQTGTARHVLVIGSELFSPLLLAALRHASRFRARQRTMLRVTASLFGDGAGAIVLGRDGDSGMARIRRCETYSLGTGRAPGILGAVGGVQLPFLDLEACRETAVMEHDYAAIARFLGEVGHRLCDSFGAELQRRVESLALIVPAQANGQIRETLESVLRERCGDSAVARRTKDKVFVDIADVGNTGSASIYIALEKIRRQELLPAGGTILLVPAEATKWFYGIIELTV